MVLYCREVSVWCHTDYSSMGPLCGLRPGQPSTTTKTTIYRTIFSIKYTYYFQAEENFLIILTEFVFYILQSDEDEQKMAMMRKAFQMFDTSKSGFIDTIKISTILNTMGQLFDDAELQAVIDDTDPESKLLTTPSKASCLLSFW